MPQYLVHYRLFMMYAQKKKSEALAPFSYQRLIPSSLDTLAG
jgi:hypothetical protein